MGSLSKIVVSCAVWLALALPAIGAEPIRIGAVLSITGPAAFLGEPERNTAKMLEEEVNRGGGLLGRKVEFVIYDDESDSTKAVMAFDRLIKKDRVVAVAGPTLTGSTLAVVPKAEEARVPLVSMAGAKKIVQPVKKWVFKSPQSDELAVKAILKHAKKAGIAKVALITATDAYGAAGREELKEFVPGAGMTVVADEVFGPKDTDMTVQLTKIRGTDAQAIICWGANPGPAVIVRNRAQLGIKLPLYMSHAVGSKKFIELAGPENAEGILLPAGRLIVEDQVGANHPQKKVLATYKKDYEKKFQQEVSTFGGHSWDALMLIVNAIRLGKSAEPAAIRDALEKVTKFQGTAGEFNMSAQDHNGLGEGSFVMVKIIKGDWEAIQ